MWLSLVLLAVLLLAVLHKVYRELFASSSPNPFSEDVKRPPAPLVTDKEARKAVLKQGQREGPWGPRLRSGILECLPFLFGRASHCPTWASVSPYVKCWEGLLPRRGAPLYCPPPTRAVAWAGWRIVDPRA